MEWRQRPQTARYDKNNDKGSDSDPQTLVNELEFKSLGRRGRLKFAFPKNSLGKAAHQTLQ
jgi:hypothetical protein